MDAENGVILENPSNTCTSRIFSIREMFFTNGMSYFFILVPIRLKSSYSVPVTEARPERASNSAALYSMLPVS